MHYLVQTATAALVLACYAAAQDPPMLVEQARFTNHGGEVERCLFSADSKRMLSLGRDECDLVWWDLPTGKPLTRIPPFGKNVSAIALHPDQPWAVVGICDGWDGEVRFVDLATGAHRLLWPGYARSLAFDRTGKRLAAVMRFAPKRRVLQLFSVDRTGAFSTLR